jgi:hypothetical protein
MLSNSRVNDNGFQELLYSEKGQLAFEYVANEMVKLSIDNNLAWVNPDLKVVYTSEWAIGKLAEYTYNLLPSDEAGNKAILFSVFKSSFSGLLATTPVISQQMDAMFTHIHDVVWGIVPARSWNVVTYSEFAEGMRIHIEEDYRIRYYMENVHFRKEENTTSQPEIIEVNNNKNLSEILQSININSDKFLTIGKTAQNGEIVKLTFPAADGTVYTKHIPANPTLAAKAKPISEFKDINTTLQGEYDSKSNPQQQKRLPNLPSSVADRVKGARTHRSRVLGDRITKAMQTNSNL